MNKVIFFCILFSLQKNVVEWKCQVKMVRKVEVAEWSKAVDQGSIPKGRGFKPHLLHFFLIIKVSNKKDNEEKKQIRKGEPWIVICPKFKYYKYNFKLKSPGSMMCLSQQKQEQIFAMEKKGQKLVCKTSFEQKKLDIYEAQGKRGRVQDDSFYFESMGKVHVGNHASMGEEKISGSSKLKIKSSREELALQSEKIRQPESLGGVRESYGEVIFNHQRVKLNSSQKVLLQIQLFLDDKLHFLKFQREKSKGQSFQILRRSFLEDRIFLELKQLRQMLFIMPDLYICNWRKDQANKDQLIISLPESLDLQSRKKEFLQKLITYLFTQKQDPFRVQVPQSSLFYEPSTGDSPSTEKKKNHAKYDIWKNLETTRKINLRSALQSPNFFEEVLLRRVREREEQLRKKEEQQKQIKYGTPQMLRIFDETYKLYQKKKVSSMLKKTLMKELQIILSKTRNQVIELVLEELIKGSSDYFKVNSSHTQGLLIEVKKSLYNETRKKIIQCQKQN